MTKLEHKIRHVIKQLRETSHCGPYLESDLCTDGNELDNCVFTFG